MMLARPAVSAGQVDFPWQESSRAEKRRGPLIAAPLISPLIAVATSPFRPPLLRRIGIKPVIWSSPKSSGRRQLKGFPDRRPLLFSVCWRSRGNDCGGPAPGKQVEPLAIELPRNRLRDTHHVSIESEKYALLRQTE